MQNKITDLKWDSTFFNKKIGELSVGQDHSAEEIKVNNYDLIVVKQVSDKPLSIPGYRETFKETKVIFSKNLYNVNSHLSTDILDTDNTLAVDSYFFELAYESGKYSRFLQDPKFGEEKFRELYREWVINSLNKKFAVKTFYLEENKVATSFVTLQKDDHTGKIGLIAADPNFQGKGLGRKLLQHAENYCLNNSITRLEIPTQKENLQACRFYEKAGYEIKDELIIKHFWRND
ncbi:GNAT family N-acetyltransferase [Chryseobacterium caseinilyticum]|uniref:GNAT family N-acetyltransferase n=1 Tax=Chryseobacterium caseinilyticum TaxID=2771428 RepID=A0ABR8ZG87_9FLAO|nr:GNAT family N-acetyltransferase [Chryseobacterium caseinilyticum]MBD8084316.1 GNAT family N-acetyltransferase [Chryseobacterium caseinilyticum]